MTETDRDGRTRHEEFAIDGDKLLSEVKRIIGEGNVRRITIKHDGRTLIEIPLTLGAIGAVLLPALAAVGAIAALVTRCTIVVERVEAKEDPAG